jgi:hypothetical protein
MALLRFPTVRDLYAAFPTAQGDVGIPASDEPCVALLRSLMTQEAWAPAIAFCAYLLPRREAVWWGCQSLRSMRPQLSRAEIAALDAAEAWVHEPDETHRRAALDLHTRGDAGLPAIWMALAAGWSGGSIVPPEYPNVRAPPEQTARAVRSGLLIALCGIPAEDIGKAVTPCIENGIALVLASSK